MGVRRKGRILAFQAIYSYEIARPDVADLLQLSWMDNDRLEGLQPETLAFARLLIAGTVERLDAVDEVIKGQLEHWDFSRLSKVDLAILRMSAYSLLFQKDIPATVTIDEAVDIAKEFGTDDSYRFINGVLDGIRKQHRL